MRHRSYQLELSSIESLRPCELPRADVGVVTAAVADAGRCRFLWSEVGSGFWTERLDWSAGRWATHLGQASILFGIARSEDEDIGFFELVRNGDETKLEGFGLLPRWRGKGLGGALLSVATRRAFETGAKRVWLHTATDDHPQALANYLARGYRIYHEQELKEPMPEREPPTRNG